MKLGCMLVNFNNGTGARAVDCGTFPQIRKPDPDNFLDLCLDSYFRATVGDWPFVIVDDGSTDDSADIIDKYSGRLARFIREKENLGLTRGMNKAAEILISEHGCDIICRFDADIEFLTRGWDLRFVQYFQQNRKVGAVGACQLLPYGAVWALGDMLIHPAGYTHILNLHRPNTLDATPPLSILPGLDSGEHGMRLRHGLPGGVPTPPPSPGSAGSGPSSTSSAARPRTSICASSSKVTSASPWGASNSSTATWSMAARTLPTTRTRSSAAP